MPDLARDTKHLLKIKSAAMRGFFVLMFVVALCLTLSLFGDSARRFIELFDIINF
jgi:hypothetical protein